MARLVDNYRVDDYTVIYFIKETLFCSSYRVINDEGRSLYMKTFDISIIPPSLLIRDVPKEILICKELNHKNIISYVDSGSYCLNGNTFAYLITDFFVGELLSDSMRYTGLLTHEDKFRIIYDVVDSLRYLSEVCGYAHNDICPQNIVLVSDPKEVALVPIIIDLGHAARPHKGSPVFPEGDINPIYRAPETIFGDYSFKSDVFSLSVLWFELLFERLPWIVEYNKDANYQDKVETLIKQRTYPVHIPTEDSDIHSLLARGLSANPSERPTYEEILASLSRNAEFLKVEEGDENWVSLLSQTSFIKKSAQSRKNKGGFDDVAGMDALKQELRDKVLWVLKNPEKAARYRIMPPNGMLLYGPPGCGKTFFAQKFAEESGFNYQLVCGSDLGSTLVHGSQIKIGELFQEAAEKAPTVLCFDEFDAFVPVRGARGTEYANEEVNEFLTQLSNCAERGIFVIGTTNRKDMIDPAVLRKGRLDLQFYIPAPDFETRKLVFKKHLSNRPLSKDIDYDVLADKTNKYASSDIAYIVNEAAIAAALADELICQRHLMGAIKGNKSSIESTDWRARIGF